MLTAKFSDNTLALLKKAGWDEGRRVDITPYESASSDYRIFPCVREFLSCFGGLTLWRPVQVGRVQAFPIDLRLDMTLSPYYWDDALDMARKLNTQLCPLGTAYDGDEFIFMDEAGRVHETIYYNYTTFLLGHDGDEAIENFLTGDNLGVEYVYPSEPEEPGS